MWKLIVLHIVGLVYSNLSKSLGYFTIGRIHGSTGLYISTDSQYGYNFFTIFILGIIEIDHQDLSKPISNYLSSINVNPLDM